MVCGVNVCGVYVLCGVYTGVHEYEVDVCVVRGVWCVWCVVCGVYVCAGYVYELCGVHICVVCICVWCVHVWVCSRPMCVVCGV